MPAPPAVTDLVEHFQRNLDQYRSPQYKEAEVRREFIDPFFEALGWDVQNRRKYAEAYKDVVHEPSLETEDAHNRAPDYRFQPAGHTKFFVEAKKPSVNLDEDHAPALQLRRYGWTQQLPISILTNFAQFAVYDCRVAPGPADGASTARVLYYTFDEYLLHWDELDGLFSRDAVFKGSFDRFAETRKRKGVAPFDERFLDDMEEWRKRLASNIALRNKDLSQSELNYAVQQTIDRILFLRICEARGIEKFGKLRDEANDPEVYATLVKHFLLADNEYNSGLFHFRAEHGRLAPDQLTPTLHMDDQVLRGIVNELYWPKKPYAFEVVPADILGQVYERFLGKVIRLTPGHQAKVEEKPEVKKAGGVYYTPTYIVDYIVKNTVGKLVDGKTPKEAAKLRVLDPACGSGSFLLGAYDFLLKWYLGAYVDDGPEKHKQRLYQTPTGWKLAISEKKQILLNNIYGVDIDPQAVEVTKLSLLLKVLEAESEQTAKPRLIKEPALPDLDRNIKCGNSLIAPDFFKDRGPVDEEVRHRINAFDWRAEFSGVLKGCKFNAVIGNPPYVRIQTMKDDELKYLASRYQSATGNFDIYCLFVERGLTLLEPQGIFGFIVPHRFAKTEYGEGLRKLLLDGRWLHRMVDFDGYMVFSQASINTCILLLRRNPLDHFYFAQARAALTAEESVAADLRSLDVSSNHSFRAGTSPLSRLSESPWVILRDEETGLWEKLSAVKQRLGDITTHIFQGLKTGADPIFIGDVVATRGKLVRAIFPFDGKEYDIEGSLLRPLIKGGHMKRYELLETTKRILFPYIEGSLIPARTLQRQWPRAWKYLSRHKEYLQEREEGVLKGPNWYGYTRSQALSTMHLPKILTPDYYAHASYCLDAGGTYFFCGGGAGGYGIVLKPGYDHHYVLGLLNSRLLDWYLRKVSMRAYQTAYLYIKKYIEQLPIAIEGSSQRKRSSLRKHISQAVEEMLLLKVQTSARTEHEAAALRRQIEATERQIDQLVYQLYGLTDDEIVLVESSTAPNTAG